MSGGRITRDHRYSITPEHLTLDPRISDRAYRLWGRLDRYAGADGAAMPTRETLAIELRTSPSSIDRAQRELVQAGWLRVIARPGTSNSYELITAPTAATMKLVKEAREKEKMETVGRREKASERNRAKKARQKAAAKVNSSANAQVSEGGLTTSDETPTEVVLMGGLITSDETGLITSDEGGLITGDEEKEASPKEASDEGDSDPSLRSGSAEQPSAISTLPGLPQPEAEAEEKPNPFAVAGDFLNWFETTHNGGAKVMKRDRTKAALAKEYIGPALEAGATLAQVKRALTKCLDRGAPTEFPAMGEWRARLREEMTGAQVITFPGRGRSYNDEENHGTQEERQARLEALKERPIEDIEAEVDEMFQPPRRQRPGQQ